jgi:hypothetical protein
MLFTYVFTIYLRFTPSIILPLPPSPLLDNLNRFHPSIFICAYKTYPPYTPSSLLFLCLLPSHWLLTPGKDLFLPPALYFFFNQVYIDSPGGGSPLYFRSVCIMLLSN